MRRTTAFLVIFMLFACGGDGATELYPTEAPTEEYGTPVASDYWIEGGSDFAADSLVIETATATISDSEGRAVPWTLAALTDGPITLHDRGDRWVLVATGVGYGGIEVLVEGERWLIAKTVVCDMDGVRYVAWYHSSGEAQIPC